MTHRDSPNTPTSRGQGDRAVPGVRRPAPTGAQRGGFTESELALIHATADANNTFICIECAVVPDGTFPPTPDGALRPEVARILASLRKDAPAPRAAGFGAPAERGTDRLAAGSAVAADPAALSRGAAALASGAAYDRQAYDLEASRLLAVSTDGTADAAGADLTAVAEDTLEAGRG